MSANHQLYRTLVTGRLVQRSGLSVGGSAWAVDHDDSCHRDGQKRLTIPGAALAGSLIETAARIFPALVDEDDERRLLSRIITAKEPGAPKRRGTEDVRLRQSVWRFSSSQPLREVQTEWRQGVGIRQATGATAAEKRALYDFEFVPAGTEWSFCLEIDTHRGGQEAEAVALIALHEWFQGRGWLGRSAARGTGWIELHPETLLRLPRTDRMLEAWPDNRKTLNQALAAAIAAGAKPFDWAEAVGEARRCVGELRQEKPEPWRAGDWHYLSIPVTLNIPAAPETSAYGLDVLQVGGHPAVALTTAQAAPLAPLSAAREDWLGGEYKQPDAPFVTTRPAGADTERPYLPGGGLRGPLRHTVSRLQRGLENTVRDPNWREDPAAKQLKSLLNGHKGDVLDKEVRSLVDDTTSLFGAEELCGRILVSDALPSDGNWQLARVDHHAEDEFTAGVYGSSKFDRNVLLNGTLRFELLVEASTLDELKKFVAPLQAALDLTRLGHLPVGGGKWRGAGWVPWRFGPISIYHVGTGEPVAAESSADDQRPIPDRLNAIVNQAHSTAERAQR